MYATNLATGGRLDGGITVHIPGWVAETNSYTVVGWSANVAGENWSAVAAQLAGSSFTNGVWRGPTWLASSDGGFFGVSDVGFGFAPPDVSARPDLNLFGSGPSGQGTPVSTGFDLFVVSSPEPSVSALFAIGAVVVLWSRRQRASGASRAWAVSPSGAKSKIKSCSRGRFGWYRLVPPP